MDVLKIAALAVSGALLAMTLRHLRPGSGAALTLAAGALAALLCLPALGELLQSLQEIARSGGVSDAYLLPMLKATGVALLMDFAAQTCRDAGEESLAQRTELAGRIMLLSLALPFMRTLLQQVLSLSP